MSLLLNLEDLEQWLEEHSHMRRGRYSRRGRGRRGRYRRRSY